jgi:hypothetical protein
LKVAHNPNCEYYFVPFHAASLNRVEPIQMRRLDHDVNATKIGRTQLPSTPLYGALSVITGAVTTLAGEISRVLTFGRTMTRGLNATNSLTSIPNDDQPVPARYQ